MTLNCLITGVGGQGTVLLSRLIGAAALDKGIEVRGSETIGMAQRGGSVVSHIRLGEASSPLVPPGAADLVIAFETAEAARVLPFLAPGGRMLVLDLALPPAGSGGYDAGALLDYLGGRLLDRLTVLPAGELAARCGSPQVVNTALLGAALARNCFPFDAEDMRKILAQRIPPAYRELNLKALEIGLRWGEPVMAQSAQEP